MGLIGLLMGWMASVACTSTLSPVLYAAPCQSSGWMAMRWIKLVIRFIGLVNSWMTMDWIGGSDGLNEF